VTAKLFQEKVDRLPPEQRKALQTPPPERSKEQPIWRRWPNWRPTFVPGDCRRGAGANREQAAWLRARPNECTRR